MCGTSASADFVIYLRTDVVLARLLYLVFSSLDLLPKIIFVRLDLSIYIDLCIPISSATTHATCAFNFSTRVIPTTAQKWVKIT